MKHIQSIIAVLLSILVMSCTEMNNETDKNDQSSNSSKPQATYNSTQEAALAAQKDMISASEQVNFGVDKNALRDALPGNPIVKNNVDWNSLLQADSNASMASISSNAKSTIVPLVNNGNVVAVVSLSNKDQQYAIAGLGDKQISDELDMVWRMTKGGQAGVTIYEIPNIQTMVYEVIMDNEPYYYTSYSGNSIRRPVSKAELIPALQRAARVFEKEYKGKINNDLVR